MAAARRWPLGSLIAALLSVAVALTACGSSPQTPAMPTPLPSASTIASPVASANATATVPPTAISPPSATATPPSPPRTSTTTVPARRPTVAATTSTSIIRFTSSNGGAGEVAIEGIRPDGTGRGTYTALPGRPWAPRLSPDGMWLLFSSTAPTQVGRAQDLDLNGSGSPGISIARADGTGARALIDGSGNYNGWSWSPDGRRVAFASNRTGTWDLYVVNVDGTGLVRLTSSPSQDGWPAWLPDGSALVFASTRSDRAQLYRVGANGGAAERLLTSPTIDTEPAVARDGRIAFSAQTPDGTGEIAVLTPGGAPPRRLTARGDLNTSPAWSPDGARIVFVGQRGERSDLFAIGADGTDLRQLTNSGQNARPDWGTAPPDVLALRMLDNLAQSADRWHSGTLDALMDDRKGTQTTIRLRFDLGDMNRPPRLQRTVVTRGPTGNRTEEEIIIGEQAWRRGEGQPWRASATTQSIREQIASLSPPLNDIREVSADPFGLRVELHWNDAAGAEITVLLDAQLGLPIELRRVDLRTGANLTVQYRWDSPGAIEPPTAP